MSFPKLDKPIIVGNERKYNLVRLDHFAAIAQRGRFFILRSEAHRLLTAGFLQKGKVGFVWHPHMFEEKAFDFSVDSEGRISLGCHRFSKKDSKIIRKWAKA